MQQKEYIINENERGLSFNRGFFFYADQSYLKYECKMGSFGFGLTSRNITAWKSTGIYNHSSDSDMNAVADAKTTLPNFKNDGRMHVYLRDNHFQQNVAGIPNNDNVINIYCVYKLDPIASTRDTSFTIFTHITNGRNVSIFGADMSFSVHATNRANHIFVMGDGFTQGIHDTTVYVEKKYFRNFTEPNVKFVLSLHYNGDDSYLFVNGRQGLKFKCKTDQLVKEKLCIGNLSDQWTTSESEKTGLYGNIYDFIIDYEQMLGVNPIYDMHRYLMTKHNISL